jgi:hypothetical protein
MSQIAALVETPFYVVTAALILFVGVFWVALNHDKTLLLPFIGSAVFVVALSAAEGIFGMFRISLPSLTVGFTLHLLVAAWLSRPVRRRVPWR